MRNPSVKKYRQLLENVQRRATKLVPELKEMSYQERLRELNYQHYDVGGGGIFSSFKSRGVIKPSDNRHSQYVASTIGIHYRICG